MIIIENGLAAGFPSAQDSNEKPAKAAPKKKQNPKQRPAEARFGILFFRVKLADLQWIA